jgi:hypothetical protein
VQVAEAVVPARAQDPPKLPVLLVARAKVPEGVMAVPGEVSVTVTLQVDDCPMFTGEVQLIVVEVTRLLTTMLVVPLLIACDESPGYDAVTAAVPDVEAVKVELHVADAVVPDSVHVVNVPVTPVWDKATVPVGVRKVPGELSVTVTVHVEP